MEIKNAINILFAKFNLNYRVLIYMFLTMAIVFGISVSIIIPSFSAVFESPETEALFSDLRHQLGSFITGGSTYKDFAADFRVFYDAVAGMLSDSNAPVVFWVTFTVMTLLIRFVISFCYPAIVDIINSFMSSNMSYGFMSNMLKNAKTGVKYSFFHTLITVLADVVIVFSVIGVIKLFLPLINVFAFAVGLIVAVLLVSLRLTFSSSVLPEMVVGGEGNYFKAIKQGWPMLKKHLRPLFGAYCITTFCAYCLIVILSIVTFGVAFFILAAIAVTFIHILQLVFYYGSKNLRYYTDSYTIVNTAPIEDRLDLQEELLSHDND